METSSFAFFIGADRFFPVVRLGLRASRGQSNHEYCKALGAILHRLGSAGSRHHGCNL